MVGCCSDVSNAVLGHEGAELFTCEGRTVISDYFPWETVSHKHHVQFFNCLGGRDGLHQMSIEPFGMGIHKSQKHVTHEGSRKIKVQSAPRLRGPFPGVEGGNGRGRVGLLAHRTRFEAVDLCVHSRPPDIRTGQSFYLACTQMSVVELFQQGLSTLRRDYDVGRPQDAAIKNTELILATDIGLELGGELVNWPTRECKYVDAGEDGVFGCPFLDGLGVNC